MIFFTQCKKSTVIFENDYENVDPNIEIVDSVHLSRVDSTGLVYEVKSPKMLIYHHHRSSSQVYPQGLDIVFHNKNKKGESTISANYALVDENGLTTLKGDVLIKSERGDKLETSHLLWDQRYRTIQTNKLIRLIQISGDTTFGFGLQANEDFSRFQIKKGYAGKVKFDDLKKKLLIN